MKTRGLLRQQTLQRNLCGATAAVIGAAVIGAGATVYGADKQASASAAANSANAAAVNTANNESWTNYLASRGISQGGTVPYGTGLTGGQAINAKLPLWATVNVPTTESGAGGSNSLASAFSQPTSAAPAATPTPAAAAAGTSLPTTPGGYSPPVRSGPVSIKGV
jgi:hypothetical protein